MTSLETTTKTNHYFRVLAALAALAIAVSLLVTAARPTQVAFPGYNGKIVFESDRSTFGIGRAI